jgi:hypothetical protein
VLDRRFGAIDRTLVAALQEADGAPFGERVRLFLLAAGAEFGRIGAAQLATGRDDATLRRHWKRASTRSCTGGSTTCSETGTSADY